jgi:hypothetical protein
MDVFLTFLQKHILIKHVLIILIVSMPFTAVFAQSWAAYNTSNFTGVNAVDYQPADIAGTPYKCDVLITGVKGSLFNNNLFFNTDKTQENPLVKLLDIQSKKILVTGSVYLPSVMYSINKRIGVAFSTSLNVFAYSHTSSHNLLSPFYAYKNNQQTYSGQSSVAYVNTWSSFNFTGAYVLMDTDKHKIKIGGTAKIIQGAGSAYFSVGDLNYTINNNTINNLSGNVELQYNKQLEQLSNGDKVPLFSKSAFAGDLGAVYQYSNHQTKDYQTPYLFKISTSVRNIGSTIKYQAADNGFNYTVSANQVSADKFQHVHNIQQFQDTLSSIANISNSNRTVYKTKLPCFFMLMADYQIYKNTFINVGYNYAYVKVGDNANKVLDLHTFSFTARYDKLHWGVGVPVTTGSYATTVGISARWRYIVVGSANIFNLLFDNQSSPLAANAYFIAKIPILYRDKNRVKK